MPCVYSSKVMFRRHMKSVSHPMWTSPQQKQVVPLNHGLWQPMIHSFSSPSLFSNRAPWGKEHRTPSCLCNIVKDVNTSMLLHRALGWCVGRIVTKHSLVSFECSQLCINMRTLTSVCYLATFYTSLLHQVLTLIKLKSSENYGQKAIFIGSPAVKMNYIIIMYYFNMHFFTKNSHTEIFPWILDNCTPNHHFYQFMFMKNHNKCITFFTTILHWWWRVGLPTKVFSTTLTLITIRFGLTGFGHSICEKDVLFPDRVFHSVSQMNPYVLILEYACVMRMEKNPLISLIYE